MARPFRVYEMSSYFSQADRLFRSRAIPALLDYVRIKSLSPAFDPNWEQTGEIAKAMELMKSWAEGAAIPGLASRVSSLEGRTPALIIEVPGTRDDLGSVLIYGHLDKQPAEGPWLHSNDPFEAVVVEDAIFGRGVADDGYSCFAAVTGLEVLSTEGKDYPKVIILIEASEESGSPDLEYHIEEISSELQDLRLVVCLDSGGLDFERLWVTSSLRGNLVVTIDVKVLEQGVHSGSAGGVVPSSFRILRSLLSAIEDAETGKVLPKWLNSEIPSLFVDRSIELDRQLNDPLAKAFPSVAGLKLIGESGSERILNQTWRPSLALTGIEGIPDVQSGGNVLRSHTKAKISLRIPPDVNAEKSLEKLVDLLESQSSEGAEVTVQAEAPAQGWLAPQPTAWVREALDSASMEAFSKAAGFCGEGGSIPFLATLGSKFPLAQLVATGALGPGSNHHGPDESLRVPMAVAVSVAVAHLLSNTASSKA